MQCQNNGVYRGNMVNGEDEFEEYLNVISKKKYVKTYDFNYNNEFITE